MNTSSKYMLKLSFAIFGPVLIISALAFIVMFMMRRTHHKRLQATRNKQDPETYYAGDDFRATSAGDSTLRVSDCLMECCVFLNSFLISFAGIFATFDDIRLWQRSAAAHSAHHLQAGDAARLHWQRTLRRGVEGRVARRVRGREDIFQSRRGVVEARDGDLQVMAPLIRTNAKLKEIV